MAIVTTPGAANADSYADIAFVDAYAVGHPLASGWLNASDAVKEGKLIRTTRLLDAAPEAWTGSAVTATQALGWPRNGMFNRNGFAIGTTIVPTELKNAHAEFAIQMTDADTRTADNDILNQGINKVKAGPVEVGFSTINLENSVLTAGQVRSRDALAAVLPDAVRYLLVPSWLIDIRDETELTGLIFESL